MLTKIKVYTIHFSSLFLFFVIIILPLSLRSQLWSDEVIESEAAYNLAFHNKMAVNVWEGIDKVEEHYFMRVPIHAIILSSLYKLFGFRRYVTLSLPLISAVFAFCIVYLIAMLLTQDSLVSLSSSLLLGLSSLGVNIAKWALTHGTSFFFFTTSLLLFLISQRHEKHLRKVLISLSGITLSLASQTYELYTFLFFSFIFYYLFELRYKSGSWFKEMVLFSLSFLLPFIIWISFILQDMQAFKIQMLNHFIGSFGLYDITKSTFFTLFSKEIISMVIDLSPFTFLFLIIGNVLFVKKFPQYRNLIIGFILLPALILLALNALRAYYIMILSPFAFIGLGFFVVYLLRQIRTSWGRNKRRYAVFLGVVISIFIICHIAFGAGGRYFMFIKDWKIRNLDAYEREISRIIPTGSRVIGGAENWYVLTRRGSRLLLFECTNQSSFNWDRVDYTIIPLYLYNDLTRTNPYLFNFIKNRCTEIARVGEGAYSYSLFDGSKRFSGYSSIIFKVRDKGASN